MDHSPSFVQQVDSKILSLRMVPIKNGFTFANYDEEEFRDVFLEAVRMYYEKDPLLKEKIKHAMQVTSHLEDMADSYIALYQKVLEDE